MKKQLGIILLIFIAAIAFSGAASAQPMFNSVYSGPIINSPGTTISGGNYISNTGGDTSNIIKSSMFKSTNTIGKNGNNIKIGSIIV